MGSGAGRGRVRSDKQTKHEISVKFKIIVHLKIEILLKYS